MTPDISFSDYMVFVDESGDHELRAIDRDYPVFVLLFVIVEKHLYRTQICPDIQKLKFNFWGHEEIILHEHDIRKPKGDFAILQKKEIRTNFHDQLQSLMTRLPVTLISVLIDKNNYTRQYHDPASPYDYAMEVGLERVFKEFESLGQSKHLTHVIVESRGRREDDELELAFRRIIDGQNYLCRPLPLEMKLVPKASNSVGLQVADLMARPIGIHHLRPHQPNRAYEIIETKFRKSPSGQSAGWGQKIIP